MLDPRILSSVLDATFEGKGRSAGLLFVVCGPSCSGKTTLCDHVRGLLGHRLERVLTSTTRPMRPGEVEGVHYRFLSPQAFEEYRAAEQFYECAQVHNHHFYGTLKHDLIPHLTAGKDLLLNIDVQGAEAYRQQATRDPFLASRLVSLFIMPPSLDTLRQRFMKRGDTEADMAVRLQSAQQEMSHWPHFQYVIVTQSPQEDLTAFLSCYVAEKLKVRPSP